MGEIILCTVTAIAIAGGTHIGAIAIGAPAPYAIYYITALALVSIIIGHGMMTYDGRPVYASDTVIAALTAVAVAASTIMVKAVVVLAFDNPLFAAYIAVFSFAWVGAATVCVATAIKEVAAARFRWWAIAAYVIEAFVVCAFTVDSIGRSVVIMALGVGTLLVLWSLAWLLTSGPTPVGHTSAVRS